MHTQVELSPDVDTKIHICKSVKEAASLDPIGIFKRHEILVIDDIDWVADLSVLANYKIDKFKAEGGSQERIRGEIPELKDAQKKLERQVKKIYQELYGDLGDAIETPAWRVMRTGPEAMHFDSFKPNGCSCILSFVNFDTAPRQWGVSHTLPEVMVKMPLAVKEIYDEAVKRVTEQGDNFDVLFNVLMRESLEGLNVIANKTENYKELKYHHSHKVIFPQGAFWVLNPKTILHQVVWGAGAYLCALHCSNLPKKLLQKEILWEWAMKSS